MKKINVNVRITGFIKRANNRYTLQFLVAGILVESKEEYTKQYLMDSFDVTSKEFNDLIG